MGLNGERVKRHRMKVDLNMEGQEIKIVTRFSDSTRAGRAACYLNSGEIDKRIALEVALTCVFAPLREAQEGATLDELEESIAQSQAVWDGYMNLARQRCKGSSRSKSLPSIELETDYVNLDEPIEPSIKPAEQTSDGLDSWESATDENLDDEEIAL